MNDNTLPAPPKRARKSGSPGAHKGIPLIRVLELRKKGLSTPDIAKILGCTKETICYRLRPFLTGIEHLQAIRAHPEICMAAAFPVGGTGQRWVFGPPLFSGQSIPSRVS